ncbi:MAG: hypothetical protein IBJ03_18355 [Gemmatimonadaceae bacterium]|nr:hypothetical protein [Gemmatimonadaceae bacterium]
MPLTAPLSCGTSGGRGGSGTPTGGAEFGKPLFGSPLDALPDNVVPHPEQNRAATALTVLHAVQASAGVAVSVALMMSEPKRVNAAEVRVVG